LEHRVERFFNKTKQGRRVVTRYDKLAANDLAFIKLASIRIWLRANESTPWISGLAALARALQSAIPPLARNCSSQWM
jgi:hypothetical protein